MASAADVQVSAGLVEQLRGIVQNEKPDLAKASSLLSQLKIALTSFQSLPGSGDLTAATATQELLVARETYELASMLSILNKDIPQFERHFTQVKTFYFDYDHVLPESPFKLQILGLNLMRLLAQSRIADFHTEIELIPVSKHEDMYIKFPIQLEQYLMEGSYNKILTGSDVPAASYKFFIDILADTVRDAIADCSEAAYASLPVATAQRLLLCQTPEQLKAYTEERGWDFNASSILFREEDKQNLDVPSMRVICEMLSYAKELERIV
eukprot:CAMPEP_0175869308 /NCGR_PEP_ID=MMETSP0107_2-20121207/35893_1 /TAXON_ID=195067 ORGANISM="Goniomonas pacifica, Strain CCMP1869" /NCGR_SAMPLE_ID=MMETSP0107_2 /ASSEMBLY_ACC=CAM_ASM_000203 /LENGTH=267 /DNA_ID=CAMNT_0017187333 /DNA_START=11 /DNA_END=814 /DNA_ORIENTATION=-